MIRRDENRAEIAGVTTEDVGVADGHGEEPGESEGVVAADRLEVPAQPLRAGVDAGDHLGVHRIRRRGRRRRAQLGQQSVAVMSFESVLPQHFPCGHRQSGEYPGDGDELLVGDRAQVHRREHLGGTQPGRRNLPARAGHTLVSLRGATATHQGGLVGQPHRQVVDQVDPNVPAGAPVDVGGPPRHPGQVGLQVGDPGVLADLQPAQRSQDRVIGQLGHQPQLGPGGTRQGPVGGGEGPPGGVEAVLPARHRPGSAAEEGAAPFGGLGVHRRGHRGGALFGPGEETASRSRAAGPVQQVRPQHLRGADLPAGEPQGRLGREVRVPPDQRPVQIGVGDPAGGVQRAEALHAQCSGHPVEVTGPPDRLLERHTLQARQRVDRDEGFQRVVGGQHPRGERDLGAQPGAVRAEVGCGRHERAPVSWADGTGMVPALRALV